jgi:putative transposase
MQREGHKCGRRHAESVPLARRVRRLMRLMRLVPIYQEPKTSQKHPEHMIYPYLLRDFPITRPNQVWCTDITCIPLSADLLCKSPAGQWMRRGFLSLVAIMDWYSRKVLSWRLSNTMDAGFCVKALKDALTRYGPPEIFNSDQGSQFTSTDFSEVLLDAKVKISMPLGDCKQSPAGNRRAWPLDSLSWFASKPLPGDGQPNDRTALAVTEIRMHLPERLRDRLFGKIVG